MTMSNRDKLMELQLYIDTEFLPYKIGIQGNYVHINYPRLSRPQNQVPLHFGEQLENKL